MYFYFFKTSLYVTHMPHLLFNCTCLIVRKLDIASYHYISLFQVCEQCQNVKYEREGDFITVDIEKGMQDGQVSL